MLTAAAFRRTLVLSPHTDDAELGCGGTIARLLDEGAEVHVVVFSTAEDSLPPELPPDSLELECRRAMAKMRVPPANLTIFRYPVRKLSAHRQEVLETLVNLKRELEPLAVFMPAPTDLHQDHQVVFSEGIRAFKSATVLGYELPWNHIDFSAQAFSAIEERHLTTKWDALQEYRTQIGLGKPYFSRDFIWSVATMRGVQVGERFAEAFQVCRLRF